MHHIEPYYRWRDYYKAEKDEQSPFYGREYSELYFSNSVYNYIIHPQWDSFESHTLYAKILFADYDQHFAILEFIGEWNDCITNDIMLIRKHILDVLIEQGITKYLLVCENVLNIHLNDLDHYEELSDELSSEGGWLKFINLLPHVGQEFCGAGVFNIASISEYEDDVNWRKYLPHQLFQLVNQPSLTHNYKYID